jgi:UDP-GlcNAc:undecaprenyl-phosphate GlcNAc-1-phosphate transferase
MNEAFLAAFVMTGTCLLSAALVPFSVSLARRFGVLDHPGERKVHAGAMPRMGGVAVFAAFTSVVLAGYLVSPHIPEVPWLRDVLGPTSEILQEAFRVKARLTGLLAGGAVVFLVGVLDDVLGRRFPAGFKAAGQAVAAVVVVTAGVRTSFLPYDWMNVVVTILWLVGMTNAFNFLDNMDGLSAGVAFVASGVFLVTAWSLGELFISLLLVAFMGSLLGFLFFNVHPARVFLGDCGSLFIGYLMGSLTLLERYVSHASSTLFPILLPVFVLAVPLIDAFTVTFIRVREGRPIYVGDRRHLSHRLVALGFSQPAAVRILWLMTFCLGLGAASLTDATVAQAAGILIQSLGFVALVLILIFHERPSGAPGAGS